MFSFPILCRFEVAVNDRKFINNITLFLVVEQGYTTEPSNEYIVRGNDALMECEIPSYVADMIEVVGWVDSEATEYRVSNNYGNFNVTQEHHAGVETNSLQIF